MAGSFFSSRQGILFLHFLYPFRQFAFYEVSMVLYVWSSSDNEFHIRFSSLPWLLALVPFVQKLVSRH